jgi:hypothetical protein
MSVRPVFERNDDDDDDDDHDHEEAESNTACVLRPH